MTLIAALRCRDGLIIGSDSQETRGAAGRLLARSTRKIYAPRPGFLLAWAGAQDVAQGFGLRLARAHEISTNAERLDVKAKLHSIFTALRADPSIEGRNDNVELIVGWWSRTERKPVALHLFGGGAGEWVGAWAFGGVPLGIEGASFAVGAMRYIDAGALTLEQAKLVALKVLRDVIETSVEGIGGQVQMGTVQRGDVEVIAQADMRALHDAVDFWERQCAELLLGRASASLDPARDRGARPLDI